MLIETLQSFDTEYSADSIEWCPHPNYSEYFVCGTYQLEGNNTESTSPPCRRKGRIYLFQYLIQENLLKEIYRLETAAILDMKWLIDNNNSPPTYDGDQSILLATANALGEIEIYSLEDKKLIKLTSIELNHKYPNLLALSLDWTPKYQNSNNHKIIASDSNGDLSLLEYSNDKSLQKISSWSAHNFEAWICAADKWNEYRIFTGGDDTFMHVFDIRVPDSIDKIFTNKSHIAGVTSLLSHPTQENILLSGSYDDRLRIFDTRYTKNVLNELNLNGGIWRIKSDPQNKNFILCACMYHNFSIVQLSSDCKQLDLVAEYDEHKSICYGADWCTKTATTSTSDSSCLTTNNQLIMATCSFYDHKLCVSKILE